MIDRPDSCIVKIPGAPAGSLTQIRALEKTRRVCAPSRADRCGYARSVEEVHGENPTPFDETDQPWQKSRLVLHVRIRRPLHLAGESY